MKVRCFAAIGLPDAMLDAFGAFREAFVSAQPDWAGEKWARRENLHVTLKFLGHLPEETLPDVCAALDRAGEGIEPFAMSLSSARAVPGPGKARMLWGRFGEGAEECALLAAAADRELATLGVEPEHRPFKAHVTLVRAREPRPVSAETLAEAWRGTVEASDTRTVSVRRVTLFASKLGRGGPTYTALSAHELGEARPRP